MSVDSADPDELLRGGKAGADYLLSLDESRLHIADEVDSVLGVTEEGIIAIRGSTLLVISAK